MAKLQVKGINRNPFNRLTQLVQDHPVPIESHNVNEHQINSLLDQLKQNTSVIKSPELKKLVDLMISLLGLLRNDDTRFDTIRENIEMLWRRYVRLNEGEEIRGGGRGGSVVESPTVPSTPSSVTEFCFFAYDLIGLINISGTEVPLRLDTQVVANSPFSHTIGNAHVEITQTDSYMIDGNGSFYLNEGDNIEFKLQRDTGSGYVDIPGAIVYCGV
jgi:hypothetical protein